MSPVESGPTNGCPSGGQRRVRQRVVAVALVSHAVAVLGLVAVIDLGLISGPSAVAMHWASVAIDAVLILSMAIAGVCFRRSTEELRNSRKAAVELARKVEAELDDVFENAAVGMILVDDERTCHRANRAMCELLGAAAGDVDGERLDKLLQVDDGHSVADAVNRLFTGELQAWRTEVRLVSAGGSLVHAELALAIQRPHATRQHLIAQVIDVTARTLAEQQRDGFERELRLSQKLEAVGQLAAGLAHEINTPIQFVTDSVSFVDEAVADIFDVLDACIAIQRAAESGGDVPEKLLEAARDAADFADLDYLRERVPAALTRSLAGTERVASIVKALRNFAHPTTTEKTPVYVNHVIADALVVARNEYKYVADVVTDLNDLPTVMANAGEIDQVLLNLIVNAAHAIEDVIDGSSERGLISIRTKSESDYVTITVSDTGGGIPGHIADRVFDPFFTTKEIGRGTGQGLALARSIVDRHGGLITFEAEAGLGTTFFIHIPIQMTGAQHDETDRLTGLPSRSAWDRVLVAEEARCERYDRTAVVLVGRLAGDGPSARVSDRLLLAAAEVLRGELRSDDTVARVGDAAFGILAVGTDRQNAAALAERLRANAGRVGVSMTFEVACRTTFGTLPAAYANATSGDRPEEDALVASANGSAC